MNPLFEMSTPVVHLTVLTRCVLIELSRCAPCFLRCSVELRKKYSRNRPRPPGATSDPSGAAVAVATTTIKTPPGGSVHGETDVCTSRCGPDHSDAFRR